ncbi:DUF4189 domain-containing protein [Mycobacterium heidelbergense]|uniref:DUF4189 domain-containing protein n=1 Tax=Mycobacterium heidelbergense TaxID=53376 RepID=UPI003CED94CE
MNHVLTAKLRRGAAHAVAALTAWAALTVSLPTSAHGVATADVPASPSVRYGAIAYAPADKIGVAWDQRTRAQAGQAALAKCGAQNCEILSTFIRCGALATDGSHYQGGLGWARRMAEDDAINRLGGGRIVAWACN